MMTSVFLLDIGDVYLYSYHLTYTLLAGKCNGGTVHTHTRTTHHTHTHKEETGRQYNSMHTCIRITYSTHHDTNQ